MTSLPPQAGAGYGGAAELTMLELAVRYNDHIARRFAAELPCVEQPRVLDFGAGIGTITRRFHALTKVRPCAVELDGDQRTRLEADGFECRETALDFTPASFDLVFSSNVLEHIEDDVAALRLLASRLRPGGRIACWVPAFPLLWTSLDDRVGHVRRYRTASLRSAFMRAGLRVRHVRHEDSLGFLAALVYRALSSQESAIRASQVQLYDRLVFPLSRMIDRITWPVFGKNLFIVGELAHGK